MKVRGGAWAAGVLAGCLLAQCGFAQNGFTQDERVRSGLALGTAAGGAVASGLVASDGATETALRGLAQVAGVIFAGRVAAVRRQEEFAGSTGVVEVVFAVDDAVRGVVGSTYTMREWAGLWPGSEQPFRVGQRYLMLLYKPGASGLSSPVGGADGAIPIRGGVRAAGAVMTDGRVVDLRWIAARVERHVEYLPAAGAQPTARPVAARTELAGVTQAGSAESADSLATQDAATSTTAAAATQTADYGAVLAMLRGWEEANGAADSTQADAAGRTQVVAAQGPER